MSAVLVTILDARNIAMNKIRAKNIFMGPKSLNLRL